MPATRSNTHAQNPKSYGFLADQHIPASHRVNKDTAGAFVNQKIRSIATSIAMPYDPSTINPALGEPKLCLGDSNYRRLGCYHQVVRISYSLTNPGLRCPAGPQGIQLALTSHIGRETHYG